MKSKRNFHIGIILLVFSIIAAGLSAIFTNTTTSSALSLVAVIGIIMIIYNKGYKNEVKQNAI